MTIENIETGELAEIVAGLVRQGVRFVATRMLRHADHWMITLTGGY